MRVQGEASISVDDPEMADYPGADIVVRVKVTACFVNCARRMQKHARVTLALGLRCRCAPPGRKRTENQRIF